MAIRGPKPKPTVLHQLQGTLRKRHANRENEPIPPGDLEVTPPDWMSPSQREIWVYAMENAPVGVLRKIDRGMITIWVEASDRHQRAIVAQSIFEAERGGLVAQTAEGNFIHSPYPSIIAAAARLMLKVGSELGFTPASRPRLVAPGITPKFSSDEPVDDLERLLASRPDAKRH